jgi:hypothetical protein
LALYRGHRSRPEKVTLSVDGTKVGAVKFDEQISMHYGNLCLFPFNGTIESSTLTLSEGHQATGMDRADRRISGLFNREAESPNRTERTCLR